MRVKAACHSCSATGLYSGMCEGPGRAVICLTCGGTGCEEIEYKPYEGRRRKNGVQTIQRSQGRFVFGPMGGAGRDMTYREFEEAVPAPRSSSD